MQSGGPETFFAAFFVMIMVLAIFALAMAAFMIYCWWRVFDKAGYSGALALLMLVPAGPLILICWLAFGDWPALRELAELRRRAALPPSDRAF